MNLTKKLFYQFFIYIFIKLTTNYYQKQNEKVEKEAYKRYQNLSEEEKDKKWKKAREKYENIT